MTLDEAMHPWSWSIAGYALTLTGCLVARWHAGVRSASGLLLDLILPSTVYFLLLSVSARPIFSGLIALALGVAYAYANHAKTKVLDEPIVFTDVFQAVDIFRHPKLALPFPKLTPIFMAAALLVLLVTGLFVIETPSWQIRLHHPILLIAALATLSYLSFWRFKKPIAGMLYKMGPTGDLQEDMRVFGPFGMSLAHSLLAAAERESRRVPPTQSPNSHSKPVSGPLVLVQSESFFDARRIAGVSPELLPSWERCLAQGAQWGRLTVPSWGANTVRSEFAVLSGLEQHQLGYDRFNPYHRFATQPINSLASQMKAKGYKTICVHPFDKRFYGRDKVLANLGFDEFIDESAFESAERINGFVSDIAVAQHVVNILANEGPATFIFVITMENHGPWPSHRVDVPIQLAKNLSLPQSQQIVMEQYLQCITHADAMLGILHDEVIGRHENGVLGFYGDHLPALSGIFSTLQFSDRRSDYLLLSSTVRAASREDIEVHQLHSAFMSFQAEAEAPKLKHASASLIHSF